MLDRGLTVSMRKCSTEFQLNLCVVLYPVIVVESWVFDRDLTRGMHCIVPSESRRVNLVFDRGLLNIYAVLYLEREGKSMMYDRGLTERMHCI